MANVMSALKSEISRLARKEAKREVAPVKKASATYRGLIAALRKQVNAMQKELVDVNPIDPPSFSPDLPCFPWRFLRCSARGRLHFH